MDLHAGLDAVAPHDEEASWLTLTIFCQSHAQSTNAWQDVGFNPKVGNIRSL